MAAMAEERTQFFYRHKTSVVIDSNFTEYAANSRANARAYGATLLLVRVVCPDEVAMERLRIRSQGVDARDSATTDVQYESIKALVATFPPVDNPYAEVNTTLAIEPQVQAICQRLQRDGYTKDA